MSRRPAPPPPSKKANRNSSAHDFGVYRGPKRGAKKTPPKKAPKRPAKVPPRKVPQKVKRKTPPSKKPVVPSARAPVIRMPPAKKPLRPKHLRARPQSAVISRKLPPVPQAPSHRLSEPPRGTIGAKDTRRHSARPGIPKAPSQQIINRLRQRSNSFAPGDSAPPPPPSTGPPPLPSDATVIDDEEYSSLVDVLADVTLDDAPKKPKTEMTKRERVIDELIHTEEVYVAQLRQLVTAFQIPLVEAGLEKEPQHYIFGNVNALLRLQTTFLSRLQRSGEHVAEAFIDFASDFEIYPGYISDYDDGTSAVLALERHHRLAAVLAGCSVQSANGATMGGVMGLESLRAAPLQRVPRYILLLREILKKTPEEHPERASLELATERMRAVATYINNQKRERERAARLLHIRQNLGGSKTSLRETKKMSADTPLFAHKFAKRHTRKTRECELCSLAISAGASHGRCAACKTRCHLGCVKGFPEDCDGEAPSQLPHELLAPHRVIKEEAPLMHKCTPLDQPMLYETTPFQQRTVILFPDSLLILQEHPEKPSEQFTLVELVKWCSTGAEDAKLEANVSGDGVFSLSSFKHGTLHTFKCEPEVKANWVSLIGEHQQEWKKIEREEDNHVQHITRRLEGMSVVIQGTVPVHSSYEKPFTVFMIHMTKPDGEAITILKRYRQLLRLHKVLQAQYGNDSSVKLPSFPSKSIFNMSEKVLQKRSLRLGEYLDAMMKIPDVLTLEPVRQFLTTTVTTKNESETLDEFIRKRGSTSERTSSRRLSKRKSLRVSRSASIVRVEAPPVTEPEEEEEEEEGNSEFSDLSGLSEILHSATDSEFSDYSGLSEILHSATVVVEEFEAEDESQLSVTVGEEIVVLSEDLEEDWLWCKKMETGTEGWVPAQNLSLE